MTDLIGIFREIADPRDVNARHDLASILFIGLAATLCGAKSCVEMAEFGEANVSVLSEIVDLPHGPPSHDTFSRVMRLLDPVELERAFEAFMQALRQALGVGSPKGVVAIDGKSLRRGYEAGRSYMPPLMVGVWDAQTRLAIAQTRAPGGSEVNATLALLKGLVLKGCTVTADALHAHPAMAKAVRDAGAHYALSLKGNRPSLLAAAQAAFEAGGEGLASWTTSEAGHGRTETRSASILPVRSLTAEHGDWPGLAAIGRIQTERTLKDKPTTTHSRYVLLSKMLSPRKLAEVIRDHWSIENHLHWTLDVVFDEDDARSRKNYAPENLAVIRRMALNILRAHPSAKSIAVKMKLAAWSKDFFFELFTHMR
jgi:predicted transposase YbfD/YdcC